MLLLISIGLVQAAAPLPRLPVDTYPSAMRDAVAPAYRDAADHPADAGRAGALARLLHAWEQWDTAHEMYARAASLDPRSFDWRYLDGCVLQRLARHADAAVRFAEALALRPAYLPARVKLADALLESGRHDESRRVFDELRHEPHAEPAALFGLGRLAAAAGRHAEAVDYFRRAIALYPEWGGAQYALGLSLRALGQRDEARRALEKHAQYGARWPAVDDPVLASVSAARSDPAARARRAQKLAEDGDLAAAIAEYEAALAADDTLPAAHANAMKLYGRAGNWEQADAHFRAALRLGADLAELHYDHGVLLDLQQKWEAAADAYRQAIARNPSYAEAHNNLGQALERGRQLEAALDAYRRAFDSRPTFRLARFNAGRMLIALGKPQDAVAMLESLAEPRDAESARYVFALSVAHLRSGDTEAARKWGREARARAADTGQADLAAAIERELAAIR